MVPPPRAGSFTPNPAQTLQTGINHSPHHSHTHSHSHSHAAALSATASPSTSSPTGVSSLTKIVVAQVYLLLSTLKEDGDRAKWELQIEQLRKLIDEHGMEVFSKYFVRLVAGNAPQIFPGLNRSVANPGNYHVLAAEMAKIGQDVDQSTKIAESIETGTEDIFRDFDLSTFMEHFKLNAFDKTVLALAFKLGTRSDLRTKADAILSANFAGFMEALSRPDTDGPEEISPHFMAITIDRFLQYHPPNFTVVSKRDLQTYVLKRYSTIDQAPPSEVLAAIDVGRVLADKTANALARYIHKVGPDFTSDEDVCLSYLQNRPTNMHLSSEQIAAALTYTSISQAQPHDPSVLTAALQRILPQDFSWTEVSVCLDQPSARISSQQFLTLYEALLPFAQNPQYDFDIQRLWGYSWNEPETQLSFVCAYAGLTPDQLDATTIPGLVKSITMDDYENSIPSVRERAAIQVKHPLVSSHAMSAIFNVALNSIHASNNVEAKRVFQEVLLPNLDIFLVTAIDVPRSTWGPIAIDTCNSLFQTFLYKRAIGYDFALETVWRKDKEWVIQRLIDAHAASPLDLPLFLEHAVKLGWLEDLVYLPNGFSIDLAALAHAEGYLDLQKWAQVNSERSNEMARALIQFLMIKAGMEMQFQRPPEGQPPIKNSTTLQVRTVSALLQILEDFLPKQPVQELITVQRHCITAYPRLINYNEGFDDVIDANGKDGNALPQAANAKMEEHYKKMYGDEMQVRDIVDVLGRYKRSRDPLEQDVFACMIHGLFDEYSHYVDYPLEALATTAVLFGGIISHKLISDLPLKIGLGMILEAVRDHHKEDSMYKFGLQALMQLLVRFREWPGFCTQLLQIPGLQNTEAAKKADEIVREHNEELIHNHNGARTPHGVGFGGEAFTNGNPEDTGATDRQAPAFSALYVEPIPPGMNFEDPDEEAQDKVQFVLNNITESTLQSMSTELRESVERQHQQWFASHLVEERAKMQPNYHHVYLELVKLFDDPSLWGQVLRETFVSVARLLNSEGTITNPTERTHLKNLGGWLGLLTLASDRPIKHRNIAFKQLLIEAHDTKRLILVIPFVCKVLIQGANSAVFRPPNPWLMDIIHLLIDLYHHAELKLNLKFEIEVLCKGLSLDHKSIEPSGEILNRPPLEEPAEVLPQEQLEAFENLSLNGLASVGAGLPSRSVAPTIPDLGPMITIPPANEMVVSTSQLHDIVRSALTRALQDIIQPVVDRSVTIAAISTLQMIRKDFVTEGDENRVRSSAINMVKKTAGSLALVTSKEPLRANFTNYMRTLASDLPSGLPEGTVIMCVNSNIDLACDIIEKQAEERAVPDIEEMLEADIEARRRHRLARPNEAYFDSNTSRWSMTIPNPYKLSPNINGLNPEQMAIYEEFGRQPRSTAASAPSHAPSASEATRSLANEVLQEQYSAVPNLPTPAETPSVGPLGSQGQSYAPMHSGGSGSLVNGRAGTNYQMELRTLSERINKLLTELVRVASEAREEHFVGLPRPHPVLDVVDAFVQLIIKAAQSSEELVIFAVESIVTLIFQQHEDTLTLESLVHVLETVRKIAGPTVNTRVRILFNQQPGSSFLSIPLLSALIRTDLLDWQFIDMALSKALEARKDGSLEFLDHLLDLAIFNNRPMALFADFLRTLEASWAWISEDPNSNHAQRLKSKLSGSGAWQGPEDDSQQVAWRQDQMEYVFDEWIHLCHNFTASDKIMSIFIEQLRASQIIRGQDDFFLFVRTSIDLSVERFDHALQAGVPDEVYVTVDALACLISRFITNSCEAATARVSFLDSLLALIALVLNHHHVTRADHFNQRVFFRLLSALLYETVLIAEDMSEEDCRQIFIRFATRLNSMGPAKLPGFTYGWLALIQHRVFLPTILNMPGNEGWEPMARLISQLLGNLGEQLKALTVSTVAKDLYRATFKLLVVISHDFPEFLAGNHVQLCENIPPHCTQLINAIIAANPQQGVSKGLDQASKMDRVEEMKTPPQSSDESSNILRDSGILGMLDQAIQSGPSEDVVAQIAHTMTQGGEGDTTFGHIPVDVNRRIVGAVVMHIGKHAAERAVQSDGSINITGKEPDVATLSLLVHELPVAARYYLIGSIFNHLRFPNAHTNYFSQVLLNIFAKDMDDPEETEIRQDITRVLLERLSGFWPQPWGLMCTVVELLKNEKYMFFDLPFIKADPDVANQFANIMQRA